MTTTPIHQWTDSGPKVRILKCVDRYGNGYGPVLIPDGDCWKESRSWPTSGKVRPTTFAEDNECSTGGLFGWAWGIGRDGKEPDYSGRWIVFEALASDVFDLGGKVKAREGDVIYVGDWWTASNMVDAGRVRWIEQASSGSASATGERGSASATGWRGSASATGERGSAVVTGEESAIEAGQTCVAVAMAEVVFWKVRSGAILVQRWGEEYRLLTTDGLEDGKTYRVTRGKITKEPTT